MTDAECDKIIETLNELYGAVPKMREAIRAVVDRADGQLRSQCDEAEALLQQFLKSSTMSLDDATNYRCALYGCVENYFARKSNSI